MSIKATSWAYLQRTGDPARKLVLVAIADFADEDGFCWPSMQTIAEMAEISTRTASRHIKALEAMCLLKVEREQRRETGSRTSNRYHLQMQERQLPLLPPSPGDKLSDGVQPCDTAMSPGQRTQLCHLPGDTGVTPYEPPLEPPIEPPEGARGAPALQLVGGNPKPPKPGPTTIDGYRAHCKANNLQPIPTDDSVWDYAEKIGLAHDVLELAWKEFVVRYREKAKRHSDWPRVFRSCVRDNWYGLWAIDESRKVVLTSKGRQAQLAHRKAAA